MFFIYVILRAVSVVSSCNFMLTVVKCRCSGKALDLQSIGPISPGWSYVTTLGKLFTPVPLSPSSIPGTGQRTVTFFCWEGNRRPGRKWQPTAGGWLKVTSRLTVCTPGSVPGPTLSNEYGKTLSFLRFTCSSSVWHVAYSSPVCTHFCSVFDTFFNIGFTLQHATYQYSWHCLEHS